MMRHFHQRLAAEEQRKVNRLLNRVVLLYAVLLVASVAVTLMKMPKMPESTFAEARAAGAVPHAIPAKAAR
jgi:hypothetical protein